MRVILHPIIKPLFTSFILFLVLAGIAGFGLLYIETENISAYIYGATLFVVLLIVANIFQILTKQAKTQNIASQMTGDFFSSDQLFYGLYKNSPVPYVLVENNGKITFPNTAALRLFGSDEELLTGKDVFDFMESATDDDADIHTSLIKTRFQQGVYVNDEDVRIKREDGTSRFVKLSIFPYGRFGSRKRGLLTLFDITKQKEVDRAKTEFVSLASHQLHTPISAMKWNMELLLNPKLGALSEEHVTYLGKLSVGIGRMEAIIQDFLNVTQLELGTIVTKSSDVNVSELTKEIFEEHSERIHHKNLMVTEEGDVIVQTDRRLLRMALGNLISNAIKYTPAEGVVTVRCISEQRNVTITVNDSGIGIPIEDQERLFTKFFRAPNALETDADGTGLGLYIAQLTLGILGGGVTVNSSKNHGSTFTIILPHTLRK